jgi:double-stranded uracil-DNA glycosylase
LKENSVSYMKHTGKKAASIFLGRPTKDIANGSQPERIADTAMWVVSSTSAAAQSHWSENPWAGLAVVIRGV